MKFEDLYKKFTEGDLEIEKYFGNYENWFNVLARRGMLKNLDPIKDNESEKWQNYFLLWLYDNDRDRYYSLMPIILGDIIYENGKLYWFGEPEDLSYLFCDSRDFGKDTIKNILTGEDVFEPYWDTTDDVYRDVIEELNEKNLETLKNRIVKELSGKKLSPETEEMELIASEQGHDDYLEISSENVSRILDDEDSMKSLLDDELSDIKGELYSIHSNSYNSAYESEVIDKIWKELDDYFVTEEKQWTSIPHPYKKNTTIEKIKMPIYDFEGPINDYLQENAKWGNEGTLEYQGNFITILKENRDCLSVRFPDYPDYHEVDKNINLYFEDYF